MKIKELIKKLEKVEEEHGNLEVKLSYGAEKGLRDNLSHKQGKLNL